MKYDYLIVGAGLFGAVIARELTDKGYRCLVIDKKSHIGGNCQTKKISNIDVHMYGPHIFHTSNEGVWKYINKYTRFNQFSCRPKLKYKDDIYSFPINLMTFNQLWNINTPNHAKKKIEEETKKYKYLYPTPKNSEEWALCNVGKEIYEIFYKQYLIKQWNKQPTDIHVDILKRQVIRYDYNDTYYYDTYQGIPNYTELFNKLLDGIDIKLNENYLKKKHKYNSEINNIIYCGPIDEYYDYKFGELEYRGLDFKHIELEEKDYQGVFMVSYPETKYKFTRIIEHKHFVFGEQENTIITKEYSKDWIKGDEPFYPINNKTNNDLYDKYSNIDNNVIFGGRLGTYKYLDMDETIENALLLTKKIDNK